MASAAEVAILGGVCVLSVEQAVAAPFATRQLADLGARVIKLERPGDGDFARGYDATVRGLSSHFVWLNRGKESLTLDLKHAEAREAVHRLLDRSDVFVQNLAPGAADRLGLGTEALAEAYPRLITCSISGYGSTGPLADRKAYDLMVQAEAGLISITGTSETPAKVGISIADIAAGMYAYTGILTALLDRERTGRRRHVEISMFEALAEWMGFPAYFTGYGGAELARSGASHAAIAPYGLFAAGDGRSVLLGIQNEREFGEFCRQVLERPELAADPRFRSNPLRCAHREALTAAIEQAFARWPAEQVTQRLHAAGIAYAALNTVTDLLDHPQLAARGRWREIDSPAGKLRTLLPPATLSETEVRLGAVPALGEHTEAILAAVGVDPLTVHRWREGGIC